MINKGKKLTKIKHHFNRYQIEKKELAVKDDR